MTEKIVRPKYKTPDDLHKAIKEYCDNPPLKEYRYKNDVYEAPCMTFDALADGIGFKYGRQAIYDQENRGEEFAKVVEYARSRIRSYWAMAGEHGNASFANYMLSCMGEVATSKVDHTSSDGSMSPKGKTLDDFYTDSSD